MLQTETAVFIDYKRLYEEQLAKEAEQRALISSLRKENHNLRLSDARLPNSGYDWLMNLQYKNKAMSEQLRDFKSGEKYIKMQVGHKAALAEKDRAIRKLKSELASANAQVVTVRNNWMEIIEDMEKQHAKAISQMNSMIGSLEKKLLEAQIALDAGREKFREKCKELYEVKTALEEEQGKTLKLQVALNRDHENSSVSSSQKPDHKKIANNREISGRKPGGQPGHEGHPRKHLEPTDKVEIPAPEEYSGSPDYRPTGNIITKQVIDICIVPVVHEYSTPEYINVHTGQRVHAEFPNGITEDVNYSGNIKGLAFLLNDRYNVPVAKVSDFISDITKGELRISTGMINGLAKEFSRRTEAGQKKAFADILLSHAMNVDLTPVRVNGKNMQVLVCATPETVLYFAREHKGHSGIEGTPIESYMGILVHDHEITFYSYGSSHQECLEHILRYLKDSMQNEQNLTWNFQMRKLIREMIHFRKGLDPNDDRNPDEVAPDKVKAFEEKYDEILEQAKNEYEYEPPSKYYENGFNLYKRLVKYKENHLLFLHDRNVPWTNNLSERLLRIVKRKLRQMMTFRSFDGLDYYCDSLGPMATILANEENLYESVAAIFDKPKQKNSA